MGRHARGRALRRYALLVGIGTAIAAGIGMASTLGSGLSPASFTPAHSRSATTSPVRMPAAGVVRQVHIPGVVSHFPARAGYMYLPPAARVHGTGRFPVVIALSGQSHGAGPRDVVVKGHIAATMDAIAKQHGGRAPIVVVPDQLGPGSPNPMCVNSSLGDAATYLTVDVRRWIREHLPVLPDRRDWTIAGFSEGGTCAIQLGAGYPQIFGSLADVSGESAPANGSLAHTISVGFGGSRARYERATPAALLARHAPYPDTYAVFTAAALDRHYRAVAPVMARRAREAGMHVSLRVIPRAKHNWTMATVALKWAMNQLVPTWDLSPTGAAARAG